MASELSTIERVALTRALSGLASGAEAIIGVASLVHRFATAGCTVYYNNEQNPPELNDPEYQKYKLCQSIDIWLFALEMLSLSGDLLARRAFRRATKKLQQSIPSGNEYNELRTAVNSLDELDSLLIDWLSSIQESHPNVYNKLITFTDEEKKFAFMFDFEGKNNILNKLESEPDLISEWLNFNELQHLRKEIKYLEGSKRFTHNLHEIEHVTNVANKRIPPYFEPAAGHGYSNILSSEVLDPNTLGLPTDMMSTIREQKNGHITYNSVWFKIPAECNQPTVATSNSKFFSGSWYKKKPVNTVWNMNWTDARIREEIIYLWVNKRVHRLQRNTGRTINGIAQNEIIYLSHLTDGTEVQLRFNNIMQQFGQTHYNTISYLNLILN
ncbi:hypothetical protein [Flavobacterium anhuiense]|nr:hypothetical protein [Flavobacterium anhuiense]